VVVCGGCLYLPVGEICGLVRLGVCLVCGLFVFLCLVVFGSSGGDRMLICVGVLFCFLRGFGLFFCVCGSVVVASCCFVRRLVFVLFPSSNESYREKSSGVSEKMTVPAKR